MKGLIDELKKDLTQEINKVNVKIDALVKRADESDRRIERLEDKCKALEAKADQVGHASGNPDARDIVREAEERHKRRKFIIVSGVPEHTMGSVGLSERREKDSDTMESICTELGLNESFTTGQVSRVGNISSSKPPPN